MTTNEPQQPLDPEKNDIRSDAQLISPDGPLAHARAAEADAAQAKADQKQEESK